MAGVPLPIERFRPLVHQFPAEGDGELVFRSGAREVALRGDLEVARRVLESCDGRRTVVEIAEELGVDPDEVGRLLGVLAEQDLVTDRTRAWRNFHRQSSARSGLFDELEDGELDELERERFHAPHEQILHRLDPQEGNLTDLVAQRRSALATGAERPVSFAELSALLSVMYGTSPDSIRPVPSGGGLYPLALHVLVRRRVGRLDPGLWWFDPEQGLWLVRGGELDAARLFVSHPTTDPLISAGHPIVFVSADLARPSRKYSNRAYRLALMETGAVMQNAYLIGAELGVPVRAVAGIIEEEADELLELPLDAHALLAMLIGS